MLCVMCCNFSTKIKKHKNFNKNVIIRERMQESFFLDNQLIRNYRKNKSIASSADRLLSLASSAKRLLLMCFPKALARLIIKKRTTNGFFMKIYNKYIKICGL